MVDEKQYKNELIPENQLIELNSMKKTIDLLNTQKQDLEIALTTTMEHGDLIEEQLSLVNDQLKNEVEEKIRAEDTLKQLVSTIKQQKNDLEIALLNAIEHGDAIQKELYELNTQLNSEIGERKHVEDKLQSMVISLNRQKEDLEVLVETIATHGDEINLRMEQRLSSVEQQAMTDALTGLCNRRCYNETLDKEWNRNARNETPLSMLVLDLDNFKNFNDILGHLAGDECLKKVAAAMAGIPKRGSDMVARYGGEEFVVLLPQSNLANASLVAEHIRQSIEALAIKHPKSVSDFVTLSIGVASVIPHPEIKPQTLFDSADVNLYFAKNAGRNRIQNGKNLE
ncbi:MAG: diguanylate cyclase [Pseudomonadota bacterium]